MSATYTFDVFCSLDGYGSYGQDGDWGGYWSRQGPEFLERRRSQYDGELRMVFGATSFREFVGPKGDVEMDAWLVAMRRASAVVVSRTIGEASGWPDAVVLPGDAVEVVRRLKDESDVPLRSHGSLSLNWALLRAGLVDVVQVSVFPVVTGSTGDRPVLEGAGDLDLELLESTTLDGRIQELRYEPSVHRSTMGDDPS